MASISSMLVLVYGIISLGFGVEAQNSSESLADILKGMGGMYEYPTSLTRGIFPKGIHSHNDYWRDIPFYTALSHGCISVEADVWLYNSTLYVGHEESALSPARTFESLYINPILSVLERQNPASKFLTAPTLNGVFDIDHSQTLYLFVDVKTDGNETWPYVVKALEPLRKARYLTNLTAGTLTSGAVTVVGTGNTPLNQIAPVNTRDYFYDGPLATLNSTTITKEISPIASTDFSAGVGVVSGVLNETQLAVISGQIAVAHGRGIMVRYWDQPGWPISLRNGIWRTLNKMGADLINADDLAAAAGDDGDGEGW